VRAVGRRTSRFPDNAALEVCVADDIVGAPWGKILAGTTSVVHLAAVAHRDDPRSDAEAQRVREVNVSAVAELTRAACAAQVQRLVLLSSVGVLGATTGDRPFDGTSPPRPHNFYSRTKLEAELAAEAARSGSTLELCVVRAPLVFGPDAPGNFGRLLTAVARGVPLPVGAIKNKRSLVSVWNLCDLLITCLTHPHAPGAPLLTADDESVSTADLVRLCATFLNKQPRLISAPTALLRLAFQVTGRQSDFDRLCGSLVVDTRQTRERLDWSPTLSLREGLRQAVTASHTVRG
jgi:nucleoside-diphosphate-sugar epimerase